MYRIHPPLLASTLLVACGLWACDAGEPTPTSVEVTGGFQALSLEARFDTSYVDLEAAFRSTAPLSFGVAVTPPEVAAATVIGTRLQVVGKQVGQARIKVDASTPDGGRASGTFQITVTPTGLVQLEALEVPATLRTGRDTLRFDLRSHFRHSAGLPLTYGVANASGPLSATLLTPDRLQIIPTGDGPGRVTLQVSAGGRALMVPLSLSITTQYCPAIPGKKLFGAPRGNEVWRFEMLDVDRTGATRDSLVGEVRWDIGAGVCSRGVMSFPVNETRTGTRHSTASGVTTSAAFQNTRAFTASIDDQGGTFLRSGSSSYGPYPIWLSPFSTSQGETISSSGQTRLHYLDDRLSTTQTTLSALTGLEWTLEDSPRRYVSLKRLR